MIVTTGKIVKIEVGYYTFERSCEHPGVVRVESKPGTLERGIIELPANREEAEMLITAYRRAINEDVPYRECGVSQSAEPEGASSSKAGRS